MAQFNCRKTLLLPPPLPHPARVGVPNSGKSEWIDDLCMNLAKREGWAFAMCSFEKRPEDHARQLLEKFLEKPFNEVG